MLALAIQFKKQGIDCEKLKIEKFDRCTLEKFPAGMLPVKNYRLLPDSEVENSRKFKIEFETQETDSLKRMIDNPWPLARSSRGDPMQDNSYGVGDVVLAYFSKKDIDNLPEKTLLVWIVFNNIKLYACVYIEEKKLFDPHAFLKTLNSFFLFPEINETPKEGEKKLAEIKVELKAKDEKLLTGKEIEFSIADDLSKRIFKIDGAEGAIRRDGNKLFIEYATAGKKKIRVAEYDEKGELSGYGKLELEVAQGEVKPVPPASGEKTTPATTPAPSGEKPATVTPEK